MLLRLVRACDNCQPPPRPSLLRANRVRPGDHRRAQRGFRCVECRVDSSFKGAGSAPAPVSLCASYCMHLPGQRLSRSSEKQSRTCARAVHRGEVSSSSNILSPDTVRWHAGCKLKWEGALRASVLSLLSLLSFEPLADGFLRGFAALVHELRSERVARLAGRRTCGVSFL